MDALKLETGVTLVAVLISPAAAQDLRDWRRVQSIQPGSTLSVRLKDGKSYLGRWLASDVSTL
jgi:hypothetical protein